MSLMSLWVIDAISDEFAEFGQYVFCPVEMTSEGEITKIYTGLSLIAEWPEHGEVVGVIHDQGQEAVEAWCKAHPEVMEKIKENRKS